MRARRPLGRLRPALVAERASRSRADGGASALGGGLEAVNKALAKAAGVSTSSAAGKVQGGAAALRGAAQVSVYDIGTVVMAELVIRYTQRARLVRLTYCCCLSAPPAASPVVAS